jgi:hypothetical protein
MRERRCVYFSLVAYRGRFYNILLMKFHICDGMTAVEAVNEGIPTPTLHHNGFGLGANPLFPGLLRFSALVVGAWLHMTRRSSCLRRPITVPGTIVREHGKKWKALWGP